MAERALTRREAFEPLLANTKSRLVALAAARTPPLDDVEFLARAVFDLESDGVGLFCPDQSADEQFYRDIRAYFVARVGAAAVDALGVDAVGVEQLAASTTAAELAWRRASLDRVLIQLITPTEVAS